MGFSLEEIKKYKDDLRDEIFVKQRERLVEEILEKKETIKIIDNIRKNIVNRRIVMDNYEINNIEIKKKNYGGNYGK